MRKKTITILTILILISISFYFIFLKRSSKEFNWKTVPVEKGDLTLKVTATGSLNALITVSVGAQVNGIVSKLYADFNSKVKKGEVIAMLDTTFLAASKEDARAMVEKAEVQVNEAKLEFDRNKKLYETAVIAKADFDLSSTNYNAALSSLRSAKAQLNRALINLQYATIKAPIDGVVISRNIDIGQMVISSFNTPVLFVIVNDLSKMQVVANIDEADIGQVKVGQDVFFTVDAYPEDLFAGKVQQIRLQPVVVQNVVNYNVILDVPNPDLKLMPGLTANISIIIQKDSAVLKVPVNAFNFNPPADYLQKASDSIKNYFKNNSVSSEKRTVWVKRNGIVYPRMVTVGLSDGSFTEVSGPVNQGDEIVTGILNASDKGPAVKNPFMPSFRQPVKKK